MTTKHLLASAAWLSAMSLTACGDTPVGPRTQGSASHRAEVYTVPVAVRGVEYTVTDLGSRVLYATAINGRGQVVGTNWWSYQWEGQLYTNPRAFLWQDGDMTDLGSLGGWSAANAINSQGQVVGLTTLRGDLYHDPTGRAFLWQNGVMTDLGTLGGEWSDALDINARSQVVGYSTTAEGTSHAFLLQNGVMTDLGTLGGPNLAAGATIPMTDLGVREGRWNDASGIDSEVQVGSVSSKANPAQLRAFLRQNGVMTDLSESAGWSVATAVNAQGQVVGYSTLPDGSYHAFLWQNGVMQDLGTLGGQWSYARGINDKGQVVGDSWAADGTFHAFLWQDGVMTDLGTLGGERSSANGINDRGQVVGISDSAFVWQHGVMTDLTPWGGYFEASGINASGQIVGAGQYGGVLLTPR